MVLDIKTFSIIPNGIFASGITHDPRIVREEPIRWVAYKDTGPEWSIYYHRLDYSLDEIAKTGDKMVTEEVIRELVPCTDEVFEKYRY